MKIAKPATVVRLHARQGENSPSRWYIVKELNKDNITSSAINIIYMYCGMQEKICSPQKVHNTQILEYVQHAVETPKQPVHCALRKVNARLITALPTPPSSNPV